MILPLIIMLATTPLPPAEILARLDALAKREAELAEMEDGDAAQIERVKAITPIGFFEPNPWQYKAIRDIALNVKPDVQNIIGHFPGNSAGKTFLLPALFWEIANGPSNKWFKYPLFLNWPFPKHFRVIGRKQMFFEDTGECWKAYTHWWPKNPATGDPLGWSKEKGDYHYPSRFKLPNGFSMDLVTPDQEEHEGVELSILAVVEPEEEAIWNQYVRAFRHGGLRILSCTMARMSEWMDRRVMQNPEAIITEGHPMDNCEETVLQTPLGEVRGKLKKASLESMRDNFPEEEVSFRWDGKPAHWRGRVLHGVWDTTVHVVADDDPMVPKYFPVYKINIDPHPGKPWCFSVAGLDTEGYPWFIDEWPLFDTFGRYYAEIKYDAPDHGEKFCFDLVSGFIKKYPRATLILDYKMSRTPDRKDEGTSSLLQRMADYLGMDESEFERQNCNVGGVDGNGGNLLKSALSWDKSKPLDAKNRPAMHVLARCKNTAHYLENFTYKKSDDLAKFGTSEVYDQKFFDFPRAAMSILSHDKRPARIVTPEQALKQDIREREKSVMQNARKFHPEWGRVLNHA